MAKSLQIDLCHTEYSGELRHFFPDKQVTLIHGGPMLINSTYPAKFRKALLKATTKTGVQVILSDKISPEAVPQNGIVTTESGIDVPADIVVSNPRICCSSGC